jgi:hypothetical protein
MLMWGVISITVILIQGGFHRYMEHRTFSELDLCTNLEQRRAGGMFARLHCHEHETASSSPWLLSTWVSLLTEAHITTLGWIGCGWTTLSLLSFAARFVL